MDADTNDIMRRYEGVVINAKPCPFCGGAVSALIAVVPTIGPWFACECAGCGARGPEICSGATPECGDESLRADAIAAWNERADEMGAADFDEWWMRTPIPAEYDSWDDCDRQRWRSVCRSAFEAGAATASPLPTVATQQAEGL